MANVKARHCVYSLLLGLQLALAGPVRRQEGVQVLPLSNDVTFYKDRDCLEVIGHMKWEAVDEWKMVPPNAAAMSLNAVRPGCKVFLCAAGTDCEVAHMAWGPVEPNACNIGVITQADLSLTIFNKVSVNCPAN